ncbi:MAG: 4-hydroxy-3-methylbut-2-enyl diphosphate reductase [Planctomycetes bacterium]|nr:4-hydroxy-3-methylbut-2-enyl diphosphate reductase [Planctomycetota bacterium]
MNVILAQITGFCDGVKRAMRIALAAAGGPGALWADGPPVHNHQALCLMELQGVRLGDTPDADVDRVLVRAHGIEPERRRRWLQAGLQLVDATCPRVARNQRLAAEAAARGATVVLAGDPDHAEVRAVAGCAGDHCRIVATPAEAEAVAASGDVVFLAQTTFNVETFAVMAGIMRRRFPGCQVSDTICRATHDRQAEAARLARQADVLVVVGGRHSATPRRLADTGRAAGKPVFLVETAEELRREDFAGFRTAAVTAGASTPGWITQEVVNRLRGMGRCAPGEWPVRLLRLLAQSRLLAALSAGGLALAAQAMVLQELRPRLALAGAAYVFFAHTLNRREPSDPEARRLSLVDAFYQTWRPLLLAAAWLAAAAALALAATAGVAPFVLLGAATGAAAAYAAAGRRRNGAPARFSVSRGWAMALGWATVLAGPALLEAAAAAPGPLAMAFVFLVCLGGILVRDLHDVASDRLMGIPTLPARRGPQLARTLAAGAFRLAMLLPAAAALLAWADASAPAAWSVAMLCLATAPLPGLLLLERVVQRRWPDAVALQAGVDSMGCLAGGIALVWGIWL